MNCPTCGSIVAARDIAERRSMPVVGTIDYEARWEEEKARCVRLSEQIAQATKANNNLLGNLNLWKDRAEVAEAKLAARSMPSNGTIEAAAREALAALERHEDEGKDGNRIAALHALKNAVRALGPALSAAPSVPDGGDEPPTPQPQRSNSNV